MVIFEIWFLAVQSNFFTQQIMEILASFLAIKQVFVKTEVFEWRECFFMHFVYNIFHNFYLSSFLFFPNIYLFKGGLSGLTQFFATESSLKMMRNAFYFTSKAIFVLKIFTFLSWLFGHVWKRLHLKDKVNFKFYDVKTWLANNCNTHIAQYLKK